MQGKSAFGHVRGSALRLQERVMPRLADMKVTTRGGPVVVTRPKARVMRPKGSTGWKSNIRRRNDFHTSKRPESDSAKTRSRLYNACTMPRIREELNFGAHLHSSSQWCSYSGKSPSGSGDLERECRWTIRTVGSK